MKSVWKRQCRVKYEPRFLAERLGIMGLVVAREREGLLFYRFAEVDR